jgi:hypothetical protein
VANSFETIDNIAGFAAVAGFPCRFALSVPSAMEHPPGYFRAERSKRGQCKNYDGRDNHPQHVGRLWASVDRFKQ